jgi:hypothetical protein
MKSAAAVKSTAVKSAAPCEGVAGRQRDETNDRQTESDEKVFEVFHDGSFF